MLFWKQSFFVPLLWTLCFATQASTLSKEWEAALKKILNYNSKRHPNHHRGHPLVIYIQIEIISFDSIDEARMEYGVTLHLYQRWIDTEMSYQKIPGTDRLELYARVLDSVWAPHLFFSNSAEGHMHAQTVMNKVMHVRPDGEVLYVLKLSMVLTCPMDLKKFPFDSQICPMIIESYAYSTEVIIFRWGKNPISVKKGIHIPPFTVKDGKSGNCTKRFSRFLNANYSSLEAYFYLERRYGYYITHIYTPSCLVVILSWVSFWLDVHAVPARVTLGILTVMTLTTEFEIARSNLPKESNVKAIDVWMAVCLLFAFAALIEFAYVNVNAREWRQSASYSKKNLLNLSSASSSFYNIPPLDEEENTKEKKDQRRSWFLNEGISNGWERAKWTDEVSRVAFPSVFIIFNIFYWTIYLLWEPEDPVHVS